MPRVRTCTGVSRVYFPSRDASVRALLFALRGLGVVLYERQIVLVPWDFLPRFTLPYTFYPRRKMRETVSFLPLLLGWNLKEPTGVFNRKGFEFIG